MVIELLGVLLVLVLIVYLAKALLGEPYVKPAAAVAVVILLLWLLRFIPHYYP